MSGRVIFYFISCGLLVIAPFVDGPAIQGAIWGMLAAIFWLLDDIRKGK